MPGRRLGAGHGAHVPDPAVVTAYRSLRADAVAVLEGWQAPDAGQERLRRDYLEHLAAHADGVAKAGPPAHLTASCVVLDATGRADAAHPAPAGERRGSSSAATSSPATPRCGRRPAARPARSPGSTPSSRSPHPVQLDRHVLVGVVRQLPRAPRRPLRGGGAAGRRPRVSAESHDVRWWPVDALPEGTRAELAPLVSLARDALGLG